MMELCPSGPLYLELGHGIQPVLQRLSTCRATSSIDSLVLRGRYCRFIDTHVSPDEIQDVLRMASCLPNLRRLSLLRLRVPMAAITQALLLLPHNERLELRSICLWGNWRELRELADALGRQSSLTKLSLADCRPEGGTCDKLDALLVGMGHMAGLQEVELDMMELTRWFVSSDSFRRFFHRAKNLQKVSLSYMRLPDSFVLALGQVLTPQPNSTNTCTISQLFLDRCDALSPSSVRVMADVLRHNTSLKELHLVLKNYEDAIPIANALWEGRSTTRLQTLLLRTYHHPRTVSDDVFEAFRGMLESNYVLQELEMFQGHPMRPLLAEHWPMLKFYLTLNKAGRKALMDPLFSEHVSNEDWIRTILTARNDLNCSFYFLSQNPSVLWGREENHDIEVAHNVMIG